MSERADLNTKQDPEAYTEELKIEYRTYRQYLKSLKKIEEQNLLEQIKDDKSLDKSLDKAIGKSKVKSSN